MFVLYYLWGTWYNYMTIVGALVYSWYPGLVKNNTTWKLYCPETAITQATIIASLPLAVTGWN
jgi:hypothetical protein